MRLVQAANAKAPIDPGTAHPLGKTDSLAPAREDRPWRAINTNCHLKPVAKISRLIDHLAQDAEP